MEDKKITKANTDKYSPGICNIGKDEIRMRRNFAIFIGIFCVALASILWLIPNNKLWRLILFIPLTGFATGIQQWYFKFCVNFGMRGLFNFDSIGKTTPVVETEKRRLDKVKAIRIILTAVLAGLILTISFYLLP